MKSQGTGRCNSSRDRRQPRAISGTCRQTASPRSSAAPADAATAHDGHQERQALHPAGCPIPDTSCQFPDGRPPFFGHSHLQDNARYNESFSIRRFRGEAFWPTTDTYKAEYLGSGTFVFSKPKRKKNKVRQSQLETPSGVRGNSDHALLAGAPRLHDPEQASEGCLLNRKGGRQAACRNAAPTTKVFRFPDPFAA